MTIPRLVVVTDLDGTLLDHHSYDWAPALPALRRLRELRIPVVFSSSKTSAEMRSLRTTLGNTDPYSVENGAALIVPPGSVPKAPEGLIRSRGTSRLDILRNLEELSCRDRFSFRAFSDMDLQDVMNATGLDRAAAQAAMEREFGEPLLWQDSEEKLEELSALLAARNLWVTRGGRFVHISGPNNKATPLADLRDLYQESGQEPVQLIALGDGANDVPMLEEADYPVLIRSPVNPPPVVNHPGVIRTHLTGPTAFTSAIFDLLAKLIPNSDGDLHG